MRRACDGPLAPPRQVPAQGVKLRHTLRDRANIVPLCALITFVVVLATTLGLGKGKDQSITYATSSAAFICWIDQRAVSLELTALGVLTTFTATKVLLFETAVQGATSVSIWLVWVGAAAGGAFNACGLSELLSFWTVGRSTTSFHQLILRVITLTFCTSMLIPSAISRNLLLVPLGPKIRAAASLNDIQTEAVVMMLMAGATKPGIGILTGYVTQLLVAQQYQENARRWFTGPPVQAANCTHRPPHGPESIAWAPYLARMLLPWGVLELLVMWVAIRLVFPKAFDAADAVRVCHT